MPAPTVLAVGIDVSVQRRNRSDEPVRYLNAEGDYEVEVSHALNKWCVTVFEVASRNVVAQDFFPERWRALARAQDFVRILNMRHRPDQPGGHEESD